MRSAVYNRNRMGPRTDPCGTPHTMRVGDDDDEPIVDSGFLLLRGKQYIFYQASTDMTGCNSGENCGFSEILYISLRGSFFNDFSMRFFTQILQGFRVSRMTTVS